MTLLYLLSVGLLPCLLIGYLIYRWFIGTSYRIIAIVSFLFGLMSTYPAIKMEQFAIYDLGLSFDKTQLFSTFTFAFAVIAFSEEIVKYIFLRYVIVPRFNQFRFSVLVALSVLISLGFATVENMMYVMSYRSDPDTAMKLAMIRLITAFPAHLMFGLVMGIAVAIANSKWVRRALWSFFGLFSAIFLHGMFDFLIFMRMGYALLTFAGIVVLLLLCSFIFFKTIEVNDAIKQK